LLRLFHEMLAKADVKLLRHTLFGLNELG